jgi:hypothetical protein
MCWLGMGVNWKKNSKEDPNKVTGWKLASNALSKEQP